MYEQWKKPYSPVSNTKPDIQKDGAVASSLISQKQAGESLFVELSPGFIFQAMYGDITAKLVFILGNGLQQPHPTPHTIIGADWKYSGCGGREHRYHAGKACKWVNGSKTFSFLHGEEKL